MQQLPSEATALSGVKSELKRAGISCLNAFSLQYVARSLTGLRFGPWRRLDWTYCLVLWGWMLYPFRQCFVKDFLRFLLRVSVLGKGFIQLLEAESRRVWKFLTEGNDLYVSYLSVPPCWRFQQSPFRRTQHWRYLLTFTQLMSYSRRWCQVA